MEGQLVSFGDASHPVLARIIENKETTIIVQCFRMEECGTRLIITNSDEVREIDRNVVVEWNNTSNVVDLGCVQDGERYIMYETDSDDDISTN